MLWTVVPQLSKCLKFEMVREIKLIKGFELNKQTNKTHVCIVVYRMAHHNHLKPGFHKTNFDHDNDQF